MAKKSFTIEPVEEKKMEINKVKPAENTGKVVIQFNGSWTFHSMRFEGVHIWDENDVRLTYAKGLYKVIGRK